MKHVTIIVFLIFPLAVALSQNWGFGYLASINGKWLGTDVATEVPLELIGGADSEDMYFSQNLDTVYGKLYPWVYSEIYGWVYIWKGNEPWRDESLAYFPEEKELRAHIVEWDGVEGMWSAKIGPGWYKLEESVLKKSSKEMGYSFFWSQKAFSFKDSLWFELNLGWLRKKIILEP
jgi:hypothetical protein